MTEPAASERWPGVLLAIAVGALAIGVVTVLPGSFSPLLIALVTGMLLANLAPTLMGRANSGTRTLVTPLLLVGIVLLGARGSLDLVAGVGLQAIGVVAVTMTAVFVFVALAARRFPISRELAVLLAVGTAICGNTAIAAAAPLIRARRPEVALAIGTVTLFGTVAVLAYPVLGRSLGLDERTFGIWAGAGVHDTSQVVATAFAFSPGAGEVATIVKLGRNTLMLPILIGLALMFRQGAPRLEAARTSLVLVAGYAAMVVANSAGVLPQVVRDLASGASVWALTVAMAAVGLSVRLGELRSLGRSALATGFGASIVGGMVALAATLALRP